MTASSKLDLKQPIIKVVAIRAEGVPESYHQGCYQQFVGFKLEPSRLVTLLEQSIILYTAYWTGLDPSVLCLKLSY